MAKVAETRKPARNRRRWVIIGVIGLVLVALCGGGAVFVQNSTRANAEAAAAAKWKTADVSNGPIDASVSATGNIVPQAEASLQFAATGTVTKIMVAEGDQVVANQPLAQLDPSGLELGVVQAQADLKQAQADYQKLLDGASPEDIAQAQAQLAQARGQYSQTTGSVTAADVAAARAKLEQAKAQLAQLQAGPKSETLRTTEAALQQAQTNLNTQRDSLSQAKTNAQLGLDRAVNALTEAQASYATAKKNWNYVQETGRDPLTPSVIGADGKKVANKVNDTQRQQYYNQFVQAETGLKNAESSLQQAQVEADTARQSEVTGVQSAEQQLAKAQADLNELNAGPKADESAAARAAVASAQAELVRLTGTNRSGSLDAARAGVAASEAALAKLTASPTASALASAEAGVARAEAALKQSQRSLDQATLKAPFAGTITKINIRVGEPATTTDATSGAIAMADLGTYHITLPIDELDVAQVQVKQPARIALDAAPDAQIAGVVAKVAPVAVKNAQGTTTYDVRVDLSGSKTRVMPGMTASVDIITSQKDNALLVPRRAIQTENGKTFVWVPTSGQPDQATSRPASERRDVVLGMSNADVVEIASGLKSGDKVLVAETTQTLNPVGGG